MYVTEADSGGQWEGKCMGNHIKNEENGFFFFICEVEIQSVGKQFY